MLVLGLCIRTRDIHIYIDPLPSSRIMQFSIFQVFLSYCCSFAIVVGVMALFRRDKRSCQENFNGTIVLSFASHTHSNFMSQTENIKILWACVWLAFVCGVCVCAVCASNAV